MGGFHYRPSPAHNTHVVNEHKNSRYRVTALAGLGLLPRVFGQDISGVFRQRYFGHVTITQRFRTSEMIGLKAFQNPDEAEMTHYIINGERVRGCARSLACASRGPAPVAQGTAISSIGHTHTHIFL